MATIGRRMLCGATLAALAGIGMASAQPYGRGGPGAGGGPAFGRGVTDPESYLAALKAELAITPAQEPAWAAYSAVVRENAEAMRQAHENIFAAMPTASWAERRDMMNGMFQARDTTQARVREAAEAQLPQLTAAQRSRAPALLPGLRQPMGGRGGGRGGGMGGGGGMGRGGGMGPGGGAGMGAAPPQ